MVREIIEIDKYKPNCCGTHYYYVKYRGDIETKVLINAADTYTRGVLSDEKYKHLNQDGFNFGGFVEPISEDENGVKKVRLGVYYD